jgi:DNA-binding NarL/FixJ family response regulator
MDGRIRVLVVDRSPLLREAIRRCLSELPAVEVVAVSGDAAQALALVTELRPDVVLMDSSMSGLDGIEATRLLKCREVAPAVVVCAVEDPEEVRQAARDAGADALVRKRDIVRKIEGLLAAIVRSPPGCLEAHGAR